MALIPKNTYPGQVLVGDPGYPLGKAQNDVVEDDGTGTPFEERLVNDLFGFQQALLAAGSVVPSGLPDKVGASDYLRALQNVTFDIASDAAQGIASDAVMASLPRQYHAALQTWRRTDLIVPGTTIFSELVGLDPIRGYDIGGQKQRLPVVFGANGIDSFRTYMSRSNDGSSWETAPAEILPSGVHFTKVQFAVAAQPGAILIGEVSSPTIAWTFTHGRTWDQGVVGFVGAPVLGIHYALQSPKQYFVAQGSGVFASNTPSGLAAVIAVSVPTPGASSLTSAEFADDGGANVVLVANCTTVGNAAIYHTADGGASWRKVQDLLSTNAPANVTYNRALGCFIAWDTIGVWTSSDGVAWTQVAGNSAVTQDMLTGPGTFASAGPAIAKLWRNVLETGTYQQYGIAYSLDLGRSWNTWSFSRPNSAPLLQLKGFNSRLYAIDGSAVWVSGPLGFAAAEA